MFTLELSLFKYTHHSIEIIVDDGHLVRLQNLKIDVVHTQENRVFFHEQYASIVYSMRGGDASGFKTERTLKRRAEPVR